MHHTPAKEFQNEFDQKDLTQLENYYAYLKLMIDGTPSKPFSAATISPCYDRDEQYWRVVA
jgi:hypothetical protein